MTGYDLSRQWFDWCFENPDKINPNHSAIYFFAIEHCNRLGWKEKFGFPTQMAMDAIGIKKYDTYIRYFRDLVDWGFFILIQKSTNQYSSNIISLGNALPENGKALSKAIRKHTEKHIESNPESNGSIIKHITNEHITNEPVTVSPQLEININSEFYPFDEVWEDYDKKVGNKEILRKKWSKIGIEDREKIKSHIPQYKEDTPDKKYRKNFETYLNHKSWNDEVGINHKSNQYGNRKSNTGTGGRLASKAELSEDRV